MSSRRDPFDAEHDSARALFDAMPQLGWVANPDGCVTYYNRRWYEYTGTEFEQVEGWRWSRVHDPDLLRSVVDRWRASLVSGDPFEMPFPLRRHDGVFRWFMTHASPLRDAEGRILRWIGVSIDIDDQKRAEQALASAVKVREDLLAIVSHDLRNPLSTIGISAAWIENLAGDTEAGARIRKTARTIVRAVEQMNRLVGDLLDLAKLEAKQPLPMDMATHDVFELARRSAEAMAPMVSARSILLETALVGGPCYAVCDDDRLQQAFGNLIGNAVKFTRDGGSIRVTGRKEGDELVISISDTGAGIPEEQLAHIFEPYWQIDGQKKRGAGLGLSVVKAIVEAHHGRVWVETTVGRGSTFCISIPMVDGPERKVSDERR